MKNNQFKSDRKINKKITITKNKRTMTTHKKQKVVGHQTFMDTSTGEIVPMQLVEVEDRDFNFHKVWLQHLISSLDEITNKKMELAFWILDNLDNENKLVMTQRVIAEKTGLSLDTVSKTLKALQSGTPPFLIKINSGAYIVNPDVIWKGSHKNRMGIVFNYQCNNKSEPQQEEITNQSPDQNAEQEEQKEKEHEDITQTSLFDDVTETNACVDTQAVTAKEA